MKTTKLAKKEMLRFFETLAIPVRKSENKDQLLNFLIDELNSLYTVKNSTFYQDLLW
jgi:hypothetical protein